MRVLHGTLIMTKVKVTFGNGETFEPNVRVEFNDNTPTRDIDLPGNGRFIRQIAFTALETHGNPVIQVWGDKAAPRPQWTKVASSHVDGGVDHDKVKKSRSRVIDLPGDRRYIDNVTYDYGNIPGGGAADVELWAVK